MLLDLIINILRKVLYLIVWDAEIQAAPRRNACTNLTIPMPTFPHKSLSVGDSSIFVKSSCSGVVEPLVKTLRQTHTDPSLSTFRDFMTFSWIYECRFSLKCSTLLQRWIEKVECPLFPRARHNAPHCWLGNTGFIGIITLNLKIQRPPPKKKPITHSFEEC